MIEATVVIPNWNGKKYLPDCLDSLCRQTVSDFRIILIDNGSEDGSVEYVRAHYPQVGIRAFHRNTGFCRAVNEGIRLSGEAAYIILLNNDTVCAPDFVEQMLAGMRRHENAFSCSARMMQMHAPERIDDAGDYYCALGWAFADGKGLPAARRSREHQVFAACGGAAIYRREGLERTGLFDERHFAYLEDVDIGYRARIAGYENWYLPQAVVMHAGSASSGSRYNAFKTKLTSRNSVYLIWKNMPAWQILLNLPFLATGFLVKTLFFVRKGLGGIYVRGLLEGLSMGRRWRRERRMDTSAWAAREAGVHWDEGIPLPETGEKRRLWKIQLELWRNTWRRLVQ